MNDDIIWVEDTIPNIDISYYMSFERLKKAVEEVQELIDDGEWKDVYLDDEYDSSLCLRGKRPETEQEKTRRLKAEQKAIIAAEKAKKTREQNERKEYERLKKKFEDKK